MKKSIVKNLSILGMHSMAFKGLNIYASAQRFACLALLIITISVISCKKDDEPGETLVPAPTGIRLVHAATMNQPFMPGMSPVATPVDLYVDNVKVSTSPISFTGLTGYFPTTSGSKSIAIKNAAGTALVDTVLNIQEGRRYSLFLRDRSWAIPADNTTTPPTPATVVSLKRVITAVVDNNTSAPEAGKAKVRFVNMSSMPLNSVQGYYTFSLVNPPGSAVATTMLTYRLGGFGGSASSDFVIRNAGISTFRASTDISAPSYVSLDLVATLEAGKLYTIYLTSTESLVKTVNRSPILLKIVENN